MITDADDRARVMNKDTALNALIDVTDALEATGNKYWLSDGTLLGAVRENDFISYDYDIDLGVSAQTFNPEFLKLTSKLGFVLLHTFGRVYDGLNLTLERDGIRVDIFLYYKRGSTIYYSYFAQFSPTKARRYDCEYAPVVRQQYSFLGHEFWIPKNPEEHLETQYGPEWKVPVPTWNWVTDPHNKHLRGSVNLADDSESVKKELADYL